MFAELESVILQRLSAKLGDSARVYTLDQIEEVPERRQHAPAVFIIYDGYRVGESPGPTSPVVNVIQEWLVVCSAKSARGNGASHAAKVEAAQIGEAVIRALAGFHLGNGKYLQLGDAPGPEFDGGFCYLPLTFSNRHTMRGET